VRTATRSRQAYPEALQRISYVDPDTNKCLVFLTNIFTIPAQTVADIFKLRWEIELFFKWINQYLLIKTFYSTSENAVKTHIWIATSIYVLVAIVKKRLGLDQSLYTILQILSVTMFEKTPVFQALSGTRCENHAAKRQPTEFVQLLTIA